MDTPIWKYKDYVERTRHPSALVRRWAIERLVDLFGHRAKGAVCELAHDEDMYVDRQLSMATAASVRNIRVWTTNAHQHCGLRRSGDAVFGRLLDMLHGRA